MTAELGCATAATYKLVPLGVSVLQRSQRPLDNAWRNMGSLSPSVSILKAAPEMSDSLTRVNICGERQLLLLRRDEGSLFGKLTKTKNWTDESEGKENRPFGLLTAVWD